MQLAVEGAARQGRARVIWECGSATVQARRVCGSTRMGAGAARVAEKGHRSGRLHVVLESRTRELSFRVRATAETERSRSTMASRLRRRGSDKSFAWEQSTRWVEFRSTKNGGWRGAGRRVLRLSRGQLCDGDAVSGERRHGEWHLLVKARMGYGDRQRRSTVAVA